MRDGIEVLIGGDPFESWKSLSVEHALDAAAGTISLAARVPEDWPTSFQAPVEVLVDGEPVFTGAFDRVQVASEGDSRTLQASGRSTTADAVDSSFDPELQPSEQLDVDLFEIALEYVQRALGINVSHRLDPMPRLARFAGQPGESAYELVERACRRHGVLVTTDGAGRMILTRPGVERAAVELNEGVNIQRLSATVDHSARFRFLKVMGQETGTDDFHGEAALQASAEVEDEAVRATRAAVIMASGPCALEDCQRQAQWEASVRAARSTSAQAIVRGLRQEEGGPVWVPNILVPVELPTMRFRGELLVERVAMKVDDQGATTTLGLVRRDAYSPDPSLSQEGDPGRSLLSDFGWTA